MRVVKYNKQNIYQRPARRRASARAAWVGRGGRRVRLGRGGWRLMVMRGGWTGYVARGGTEHASGVACLTRRSDRAGGVRCRNRMAAVRAWSGVCVMTSPNRTPRRTPDRFAPRAANARPSPPPQSTARCMFGRIATANAHARRKGRALRHAARTPARAIVQAPHDEHNDEHNTAARHTCNHPHAAQLHNIQ